MKFACRCLLALAACAVVGSPVAAQNREPTRQEVLEPILNRFVHDYEQDPMAMEIEFGIEIGEMRWLVSSKQVGGSRRIAISEGFGAQELFYFKLDRETLNLLDQGVWNGLTAMGAAFSSDKTPLDILTTDGYQKPEDYDEKIRRLIFHFWTKGFPETVSFSPANSRVVHGAPATALYYDKNFRSAVYFVPAGLGPEQAPTIAVPFPRMILVIDGSAEGKINDQPFSAKAGEMIFSPPNLPVTFWNASQDKPLSFVWLMWGDGA